MSWADEFRASDRTAAQESADRTSQEQRIRSGARSSFERNMAIAAREFATAALDLGVKTNTRRRLKPAWCLSLDTDKTRMAAHDAEHVVRFAVEIFRDGSWVYWRGERQPYGWSPLEDDNAPSQRYANIEDLRSHLKAALRELRG